MPWASGAIDASPALLHLTSCVSGDSSQALLNPARLICRAVYPLAVDRAGTGERMVHVSRNMGVIGVLPRAFIIFLMRIPGVRLS